MPTDVNATNATKIAYYNEKFGLNTGEGSTKDDQMCHGRIVRYLEGLEWVFTVLLPRCMLMELVLSISLRANGIRYGKLRSIA